MNGMLYTNFDPPRDTEDYEDFANFVLHDLIVLWKILVAEAFCFN